LRSDLDEKGLAIAKRQESSLSSRKELAEHTKEFKKGVSAELFKQVAPLLKKYQLEIDALTARSKQSEGAFLDIFQKLQDAPDPSSLLADSVVCGLCVGRMKDGIVV
jgi:homeobox protein cut-like